MERKKKKVNSLNFISEFCLHFVIPVHHHLQHKKREHGAYQLAIMCTQFLFPQHIHSSDGIDSQERM
jgi:hypothetical protein